MVVIVHYLLITEHSYQYTFDIEDQFLSANLYQALSLVSASISAYQAERQ